MIALRILAALAAAALLELVGVRLVPRFAQIVDPFIVVVVWYALRTDRVTGQLTGTAAGLVQDGLAGGLFGLHAFANTVVGYAVAASAQRVVVQQRAVRVLLFALASALQQGVVVLLLLLLVADPALPGALETGARAVSSAALGALVLGAERRLLRRWRHWQTSRSRRLRFR